MIFYHIKMCYEQSYDWFNRDEESNLVMTVNNVFSERNRL